MEVFITDLSKIIKRANQFKAHIFRLSDQDQKRYFKITDKNRAFQFLIGRLLISQHIRQNVETLDTGKVVAKNCFLSLSHSQNYVVLAVDSKPVGIDIEDISKTRDFEKIAQRLKINPCSNAVDFYREFTRYEADFKLDLGAQKKDYRFYLYHNFIICLATLYPFSSEISFYESVPFQSVVKLSSSSFSKIDL